MADLAALGDAGRRAAAAAARAIHPEELANSVSHGVGLGMSIVGLVVLAVVTAMKGDALTVTSSVIYGSTLVLLYLASTLYHSFHPPRVKRAFRIFDHSAIYLLIAGTYTPFTLVTLNGAWGWGLFAFTWAVALVGVILKVCWFGRFSKLSMAMYLGLGWAVVVAAKPLMEALPTGGLVLLGAGGLCYTVGTIFYGWKTLFLNHTIWHIFVLAGSVCHYLAVLLYVAWP